MTNSRPRDPANGTEEACEFFENASPRLTGDEKYIAWIKHAGALENETFAQLEISTIMLVGLGTIRIDPVWGTMEIPTKAEMVLQREAKRRKVEDSTVDLANRCLWDRLAWSAHQEKLLSELRDNCNLEPFKEPRWTPWWRGWKVSDFRDVAFMIIGILSIFAGLNVLIGSSDGPEIAALPYLALPLLLWMRHLRDREDERRFILWGKRERWILNEIQEANQELERVYLEEDN